MTRRRQFPFNLVSAFAALAALLAVAAPVRAAETEVGTVTRIQALAQAVTDNRLRRLADDSPVYLNDLVTTGDKARLEITFADGTRFTLGERGELRIDDFVYAPGTPAPRIDVFTRGAFRFVTGLAGKATDKDIQVRTPLAVIGIRGTDFFGGMVDDQYGVLLFEGAVSVANPFGQSLLNDPGQGTNIAGPGQPPSPVTVWPQAKVDRALSLVAFQ